MTPVLEEFPSRSLDKLRYGDTDRQGHVNNAVYGTFFETGRIGIFTDSGLALLAREFDVVLAHIAIDYRREIFWPGEVVIGTGITGFGRTSISLRQTLYQNGVCAAEAKSVIVLVDKATHRPTPVADTVKAQLAAMLLPTGLAEN